MYNEPRQRIDSNALKAWRMSGFISASVYLIILAILLFLTLRFDWPAWIFAIALMVGCLTSVIEIIVLPNMYYREWRYEINEDQVDLKHGILFRKRTTIPMVRVQHVDTKQGPILRKYGLATVTFSTAAGSHEIPALTERSADEVRRQIASLARISDEEI
ncbi:PH domain-containing protein [Paenibacillus abyssi]|uniref:UPF0699 transmembrane protein YdbS n=1 Tax=Paenibacillus abyssi TaxID=1340531 RepID=A0A917CIX1_9BACL|nr:PH domain-containing protein [Paenibacillus abyssi]GGF89950.1 UPF0699 transmembrane protein YdbS [Paenibacillus abyssi]